MDKEAVARQIRELVAEWNEIPAQIDEKTSISSYMDAEQIMRPILSGLDKEELHVMLLDIKNNVLKIVPLYKGTINFLSVRIAEVFKDAIINNAGSIILVHNHPSGDPTPSPEDVRLTKQVREAGNLLDIKLLDHIIIGNHSVSLKSAGLGF